MKAWRWVVLGVIASLLIAVGAYLWTSGLMDSLLAYRSPLQASPPAPGQPLGQALTRRVVFVLVDALRNDTALKPEVMPFLNELRARGAGATMHSRPPSFSEPGYTVLLTGAWPDISDGPALNVAYDDIWMFTQDDLVSAAHRVGLKTAVSGYNWFEKLIPQGAVDASFYTAGEDAAADRAVVDAALPWLRSGAYQFVFIHIDQVDYAGHHEGGPVGPNWDAAARRADDLVREIAAPLDLNRDTLFICSDHGQIDRGGHGGQDAITLVEPWVLVGAGVRPGRYSDVNQTDVAPTLAALLGANIPASSQGQVRTEMLLLSPSQQTAVERAAASQQGALAVAYSRAIGRPVTILEAGGTVAATQAAMRASRAARIAAERLPRAILALILAAVPALILFRKRGRTVAWLLAVALLYLALFHGRYALLSGRTYSLSSVESADALIVYTLSTAALALLVSWLVAVIGLRPFSRGPGRVAGLALGLSLTVIYLLSLPVLVSFALNGLFVTWTLPDFLSTFVAFLSGMQAIAVAGLGVVLAGVAALIARMISRRRIIP